MVEHEGKKPCLATKARKEKAAKFRPNAKLTSFWPVAPAPLPALAPALPPQPTPLVAPPPIFPEPPPALSDEDVDVSLTTVSEATTTSAAAQPANPTYPPLTGDKAWLARLRLLATFLPPSVPEAASDDKIYRVGGIDLVNYAATNLTSSYDEDWEVLGPLMHDVFELFRDGRAV